MACLPWGKEYVLEMLAPLGDYALMAIYNCFVFFRLFVPFSSAVLENEDDIAELLVIYESF